MRLILVWFFSSILALRAFWVYSIVATSALAATYDSTTYGRMKTKLLVILSQGLKNTKHDVSYVNMIAQLAGRKQALEISMVMKACRRVRERMKLL